jgi:hypothetical protein
VINFMFGVAGGLLLVIVILLAVYELLVELNKKEND